jgi:hypothetical protein
MRVSKALIHEVSRAITFRDKQICLHVYEHRFLTTHQAARLFFSSEVRARARLHELFRLRVLQRFRPERGTGSYPWYYVLDEIGVAVCETHLGIERLRYDRRKALAQVYSPQLGHMTEVNDFFSSLVEACTHTGLAHIESWLGERSCERYWRGAVHPDGFAVLRTADTSGSVALELDGGTEEGKRLTEKLTDFATLAGASDAPDLIAFCFPTAAPAQRAALEGCPILVATAVLADHMQDPLGLNWLTVPGWSRKSLVDLADPVVRNRIRTGELL